MLARRLVPVYRGADYPLTTRRRMTQCWTTVVRPVGQRRLDGCGQCLVSAHTDTVPLHLCARRISLGVRAAVHDAFASACVVSGCSAAGHTGRIGHGEAGGRRWRSVGSVHRAPASEYGQTNDQLDEINGQAVRRRRHRVDAGAASGRECGNRLMLDETTGSRYFTSI